VPTEHGIRLDDRQRAPHIGEQPIKADQYQSVHAADEKPFWRGPPQDVYLLAQHQVLRFERSIGAARQTPTRSDCKSPASDNSIAGFAATRHPREISDRDRGGYLLLAWECGPCRATGV